MTRSFMICLWTRQRNVECCLMDKCQPAGRFPVMCHWALTFIFSYITFLLMIYIVILSEVSQRRQNIVWHHNYLWKFRRNETNELTKQNETHRLREQTYGSREGWREGIVREFGMNMYTLLYLKWKVRLVKAMVFPVVMYGCES